MGLIRKRLTEDEFSNPALRYDDGCDCVQFTPDGGTTWVDNPTLDPRTSEMFLLPPLTGSDVQCRAAEGMVTLVRALVDQRIEDDTALELAGAILGIVAFIPGFNVLYALIIALATFMVTIAREVLEAAFTEATYDQIRCIFYCNIDAEGVMSEDGFTRAYEQLIDLNAVARTWVQAVMNTFGRIGLTDAGVALEGAADCDCECEWCYEEDFLITDGGYSVVSGGVYTTSVGWEDTLVLVGGLPTRPRRQIFIAKTFPATGTIRRIELQFDRTFGDTSAMGGSGIFNSAFTTTYFNGGSGGSPFVWTGEMSINNIGFALSVSGHDGSSSDPGGTGVMLKVRWRGIDDCPFGTPNCE